MYCVQVVLSIILIFTSSVVAEQFIITENNHNECFFKDGLYHCNDLNQVFQKKSNDYYITLHKDINVPMYSAAIVPGVVSIDGAGKTINANMDGRGIWIFASDIHIINVTIKNGIAYDHGGCIYLESKNLAAIYNTVVSGCSVYDDGCNDRVSGGCVHVDSSGPNVIFHNSLIENCEINVYMPNSTACGGSVCIDGTGISRVTLSESRFLNSAISGTANSCYGGSIYIEDVDAMVFTSSDIINSTISTSDAYGGCMYVHPKLRPLSFRNGTFDGCNATGSFSASGGAIFIDGYSDQISFTDFRIEKSIANAKNSHPVNGIELKNQKKTLLIANNLLINGRSENACVDDVASSQFGVINSNLEVITIGAVEIIMPNCKKSDAIYTNSNSSISFLTTQRDEASFKIKMPPSKNENIAINSNGKFEYNGKKLVFELSKNNNYKFGDIISSFSAGQSNLDGKFEIQNGGFNLKHDKKMNVVLLSP